MTLIQVSIETADRLAKLKSKPKKIRSYDDVIESLLELYENDFENQTLQSKIVHKAKVL
jgi:hypothetical protein